MLAGELDPESALKSVLKHCNFNDTLNRGLHEVLK